MPKLRVRGIEAVEGYELLGKQAQMEERVREKGRVARPGHLRIGAIRWQDGAVELDG